MSQLIIILKIYPSPRECKFIENMNISCGHLNTADQMKT